MVTTNVDPMSGVSEMTKQTDNPGKREQSYFDGKFWDAKTRDRLGIPLWTRLDIPNVNKHRMGQFSEMVRGLATQMEYISKNGALTEHDACTSFRNLVWRINLEMKAAADIDMRSPENRGKRDDRKNRQSR